MEESPGIFRNKKVISIVSLIVTIGIVYFVDQSLILFFILPPIWFLFFRPLNRAEIIMFVIASLFILGQNYPVLKTGGFSFKHKDILLMPYYEPFMWGFYYLNIKRFFGEPSGSVRLGIKAFLGLVLTGICR